MEMKEPKFSRKLSLTLLALGESQNALSKYSKFTVHITIYVKLTLTILK